jgi:hypothetical protein
MWTRNNHFSRILDTFAIIRYLRASTATSVRESRASCCNLTQTSSQHMGVQVMFYTQNRELVDRIQSFQDKILPWRAGGGARATPTLGCSSPSHSVEAQDAPRAFMRSDTISMGTGARFVPVKESMELDSASIEAQVTTIEAADINQKSKLGVFMIVKFGSRVEYKPHNQPVILAERAVELQVHETACSGLLGLRNQWHLSFATASGAVRILQYWKD